MPNQTLLPTEKQYPERFILDEHETGWAVECREYEAPLHPEPEKIIELLAAQGVEVKNERELRHLAKLSTAQAIEVVGSGISELRHPLGRTGINGTGIYYKAGKTRTADMAILRDDPLDGLELALIFNRGKWRLPGGFIDSDDNGDLVRTAIREAIEETTIDLSSCADKVLTLIPEQVKPNSRRSVDLGYVTSQVSVVMLPNYEMGYDLACGDDAQAAAWFDHLGVELNYSDGQISKDHFGYMLEAFKYGVKTAES
jgi:ADP-ribose pyrophosphatase YjhB (NUDIX family)